MKNIILVLALAQVSVLVLGACMTDTRPHEAIQISETCLTPQDTAFHDSSGRFYHGQVIHCSVGKSK